MNIFKKISGRLVYRIAAPVVLTILVMGMALYAFNLRLISNFAEKQINESMSRLSHEIYSVCDRNFTELLQKGFLGDEKTVRIIKAATLGAIEDFMRKNNIAGQIFDNAGSEFLPSKIPSEYLKQASSPLKQTGIHLLNYGGREYYTTQIHFEPWAWQIVVFKDASEFSNLTQGVRIAYIITGIILLFSGVLLLFSIHKAVAVPVELIIADVKAGRKPEYKGTNELEFLVATINQMMDAVKEREAEMRDSERRLADIINFLPDATLAVDRQGKVIAWNHAIEEMTGVRAKDIVGKDNFEHAVPFFGTRKPLLLDLLFSSDEENKKKFHVVTRRGMCLMAEADVPLKGLMRTLWGIASPLYDSAGNIEGSIQSIRDITERKQAENDLKKYQGHLEDLVKERTAELIGANDKLKTEITERKKIEEMQQKLVHALQEALAKVKQLSGFLPICSSCKKIRDDKGYWNQIEAYLREHSEAEFSHGLCPDCAKRIYPAYYKDKEKQG